MAVKIKMVPCGSCNLATPKQNPRCIHCEKPVQATREVIIRSREPEQLMLAFSA